MKESFADSDSTRKKNEVQRNTIKTLTIKTKESQNKYFQMSIFSDYVVT